MRGKCIQLSTPGRPYSRIKTYVHANLAILCTLLNDLTYRASIYTGLILSLDYTALIYPV